VDAAVKGAFTASGASYGSPRIHVDLLGAGWRISVNTIAESMARQGLVARAKKHRKTSPAMTRSKYPFPDLVCLDFIAPAPNVNHQSTFPVQTLTP